MNTLNEVETCLRDWTPRRPSPSLERRLFPRTCLAESRPTVGWLWFSPVAACLLTVLVSTVYRPDGPMAAELRQGPLVALILSNQSYAPYLPGSFQRNENRWDSTFDWTNTRGFPSSDGPFLRSTQRSQTQNGQD
jgi:hypothetical protein